MAKMPGYLMGDQNYQIGYCRLGGKQYVAFEEIGNNVETFAITDGFHDKEIKKGSKEHLRVVWVTKEEINLKKIVSRMRGARPWHPLLRALRRELQDGKSRD